MFVKKFALVLSVIGFIFVMGLAACSGGTAMPAESPAAPASSPTQPPSLPGGTATAIEQVDIPVPTPEVPETITEVFGPPGGSLESDNGLYRLVIPPGALDRSYTFTMNSWQKVLPDEGMLAPVIEILTDPVLEPVAIPMQLVYMGEKPAEGNLEFLIEMIMPLEQAVGGGVPPAIWIPLTQLFDDEAGHAYTWVTHFTRFVVRVRPDGRTVVSIAPPIEFNQPGYVPVGRFDLQDTFLTRLFYPKARPIGLADVLVYFPKQGDRDAAIQVFTPASPTPAGMDQACEPLSHQLSEPDNMPIGYGYLGATVTRNGTLDQASSTLTDESAGEPWSQVLIKGNWNGENACETQIQSHYVPSDTLTLAAAQQQNCLPDEAMLEPGQTFGDYVYIGRAVAINGFFVPDLSSLGMGTMLSSSAYHNTSKMTTGDGNCTVEVKHYFDVPQAEVQSCGPAYEDWNVPPAPQGLTYVGREVFTAGETTIGLPEYYTDGDVFTYAFTATQKLDAESTCTYQVNNYFRPTAQWSAQAPDELFSERFLTGFQLYATYVEANNLMYSLTNYATFGDTRETTSFEELLGWTDGDAVFARHVRQPDGDQTVLYTAIDYFRPGRIPPASFSVQTDRPLFEFSPDRYVEVYVPGGAVSAEEAAILQSYSLRVARVGDDGSFSVVLPPGTTLDQADGVATFTVPGGN